MIIGVTPQKFAVSVVNGGFAITVAPNPIQVTVGGGTGGTSPPVFPGGTPGQVQANINGGFGGLSNAALTALISVFDTTHSGAVPPGTGGGTTEFLRKDGSWAVPPGTGGGGGPLSLAGDVTGTTDASVLATIGGVAGTYTNLNAVIDAKGRVIAATSGSGPGGNPVYNSRAQLQAAIDAASAAGGGVIVVLNTVSLDGPLTFWSSNVHLDGQGVGALDCAAPYAGMQLVFGPPTTTAVSNSHRPASVLDGTASSGHTGLATLGTHTLLIALDGIQYGCPGGGLPTYYQDDVVTIEVCIVFPAGHTTPANTGLFGFHDGTAPDPVALAIGGDTSTANWIDTLADGSEHAHPFAVDQALAKSHFCYQRNSNTGLTTGFYNGARVFNTTILPGVRLRKPAGFSPLLLGATSNFAPLGSAPAYVEFHGAKLGAGTAGRYDATLTTQTLLRTGLPPTDHDRYLAPVGGDVPLIGYLGLNGPGAVPGTEPVQYPGNSGVAWWCQFDRTNPTANYNSVTGMTFKGHAQGTVALAEELFASFTDCTFVNAPNGAASLQVSAGEKYDVKFYNCRFEGYDCPIVLQNMIYETYGIDFTSIGLNAVRENGCDANHYGRLWIAGPSTGVTTFHVAIYGGLHTSNGVSVDDENGGTVNGYYCYTQGSQVGRLQVNKLDTSIGSVPYLTLLGTNAGFPPVEVLVNALSCFGAQQDATFLAQFGPIESFIGEVNAVGLGSTAFTAEHGTKINIRNRDTAFLTGPKQALTGSRATDAWRQSVNAALVALGVAIDDTTA